jgi:iron complex outermembrane receptor protein
MNHAESQYRPKTVRATVAAILGTALLGGYVAQALAAEENLEEVQVTGSRIQQRGDYVSPTPMTTVTSADLQKLGIVNVSDAMVQIPQNVSQFTPANTGGGAFFVGSTLANLRGLNPFFGTRTLTLVDGRRFIPTTQGDSVDLNFIPSNLIQRMEVVTGGASAAYGSGAISGVVNVMLDKKLDGIKLDADYGATTHGDGQNYHVGIAGGTDFAGGKGHVIVGGEYQNQDAIQSCADARDWCHAATGFFTNTQSFVFSPGLPFTPEIPGQPHFVIVSGLRLNQASHGGVIFNGAPNATTTWQFNAAGTDITPFAIGDQGWRGVGGNVVGGSGDLAGTNVSLMPEVKRYTTFSHVDFDFTDKLSGYAELSYGNVKGVNHQWGSGQNTYNICVAQDNAYLSTLSAAARAALLTASTSGFPFPGNSPFSNFFNGGCFGGALISKNFQGQNDQTVTTDTTVTRAVLGMKGKFLDTWSYDAYYQYGKTTRDQIGTGYHTNWRFTMAVDSVIDTRAGSPTLGQPVCRATVTGLVPSSTPFGYVPVADPSLIAGCKPLNPFGTASASAAALAYAFAPLTEHDDIRQDVFAASVTGELWKGWGAGPLSGAFGAEYRKDTLNNNAGNLPLAIRTDFDLQYGDSFSGKTEVTEEFAEFEMPLLKDLPGAKLWTLNAAARQATYKTESGPGATQGSASNDITTFKFSSVWDPIEWLRVRGSYSRDIRAPGFRELFYSQSIPPGGIFGSTTNPWIVINPSAGITSQTDAAYLILSGNPAVKPEKSTTITAGLVLTPTERMHLSVDYYRIKLTGALALGGGVNNLQACYTAMGATGNPITSTDPNCQTLTFGTPIPGNSPYSNITATHLLYGNSGAYLTRGIDFAWDYTLPLDSMVSRLPGSVTLRASASRTLETTVPSGRNVAGQTGGDQGFLSDFASSPKWSGNMTLSYLNGPFIGTFQTRYVSAGVLDLQNPKTGPDSPNYNPALSYSVNNNQVPSYFVFSLNGSYDMKWLNLDKFQVFASINNLFDKNPPFSAGNVGGANATFFDTLGRTYKVGFRMKL